MYFLHPRIDNWFFAAFEPSSTFLRMDAVIGHSYRLTVLWWWWWLPEDVALEKLLGLTVSFSRDPLLGNPSFVVRCEVAESIAGFRIAARTLVESFRRSLEARFPRPLVVFRRLVVQVVVLGILLAGWEFRLDVVGVYQKRTHGH